MATPIPDSYWLIDDVLLAGEYPGTRDERTTREKLAEFLDAGIRTFIDLTETREPLARYDAVLAGIGRTGTVVGCWLVEQGLSGADAIDRIAALRAATPDGYAASPETEEQRDYICAWPEDR